MNFFVSKFSRNITIRYAQSKTLSYCSFTNTRFTNKARVIFCSSTKNLRYTINFTFSTDNSINLTIFSFSYKVCTIKIKKFTFFVFLFIFFLLFLFIVFIFKLFFRIRKRIIFTIIIFRTKCTTKKILQKIRRH